MAFIQFRAVYSTRWWTNTFVRYSIILCCLCKFEVRAKRKWIRNGIGLDGKAFLSNESIASDHLQQLFTRLSISISISGLPSPSHCVRRIHSRKVTKHVRCLRYLWASELFIFHWFVMPCIRLKTRRLNLTADFCVHAKLASAVEKLCHCECIECITSLSQLLAQTKVPDME